MSATAVLEEEWIDGDAPRPRNPLDVPKGYELIDGVLVEKQEMGYKSSYAASQLHLRLGIYLLERPIGVAVTAEASYACFVGRPTLVRKPDVSVVLCDPKTFVPPEVNYQNAPEIVVEVISSSDKVSDLDAKIARFIEAGTRLVWVVNPDLRTVLIRRADGTLQLLRDPAELTGEDVLPGFRVALADFLPPVVAPTAG